VEYCYETTRHQIDQIGHMLGEKLQFTGGVRGEELLQRIGLR
jgi:hypothetical protein